MWLSSAAVPQAEGAQSGDGWQWSVLFFCRGGSAGGKEKNIIKLDEDRSGHGQKEAVDGFQGVCGGCGLGIPGCRPERDKGGKDQLTEVTGM